jgi:hypothetical protein
VTEALEHQTATGEILRAISRSPDDVQPVFDIIAEHACTLCGAQVSVVSRVDGDHLQLASVHGVHARGARVDLALFPDAIDARTGELRGRAHARGAAEPRTCSPIPTTT